MTPTTVPGAVAGAPKPITGNRRLDSRRIPFVALVVAVGVVALVGVVVPVVPPVDAPEVDESPATLTAFPPTVTGAPAPAGTCSPDATPLVPDVVPPEAGAEAGAAAGADAAAGVPESTLLASPATLTALPPTVTGAVASIGD